VIRRDDFSGIHLPVRIPGILEFAEGFDSVSPEHLRQELGARLTVAMLAESDPLYLMQRSAASS
jgi:hypothetical protein